LAAKKNSIYDFYYKDDDRNRVMRYMSDISLYINKEIMGKSRNRSFLSRHRKKTLFVVVVVVIAFISFFSS